MIVGDLVKQILIVSDNHGDKEVLDKLLKIYPNCTLYLHAGDSEDLQTNLYPFLTVKGNNDYYIDNLYRIIKVDKHSIFMVHGHRNFLSDEVMSLTARNNNCDIFVHGHIHRPYYKIHNGVHIMCPGSLRYPRTLKGATYILLTINKDAIECEIKEI